MGSRSVLMLLFAVAAHFFSVATSAPTRGSHDNDVDEWNAEYPLKHTNKETTACSMDDFLLQPIEQQSLHFDRSTTATIKAALQHHYTDTRTCPMSFSFSFLSSPLVGRQPPTLNGCNDEEAHTCVFKPYARGVYRILVKASNCCKSSEVETIVTISCNQPPISVNIVSGSHLLGDPVRLDATHSFDPEGDKLDPVWTLVVAPPDSDQDGMDVHSTWGSVGSFSPDAAGTYVIQLSVSDACSTSFDTKSFRVFREETEDYFGDWSPSDELTIDQEACDIAVTNTQREWPQSDDLVDGWVEVGTTSAGHDGVRWPKLSVDTVHRIESPLGDKVRLENVLVSPQDALLGSLQSHWTLTTAPSQSDITNQQFMLCNYNSHRSGTSECTFTPDVTGRFVIRVDAFDSCQISSSQVLVQVNCNSPPHAIIAGWPATGAQSLLDATVRLDATESFDPDEDPLKFRWHIVRKPKHSHHHHVAHRKSGLASIVPDREGEYEFEVTVSDGCSSSRERVVLIVY